MTPNMSPNAMAPCPLGITEETLSAQRDDLLDAAEARRLSEHVTTCVACQARLRAFDTLARTIQAQRVPDLQPIVWRGLQARLARYSGSRLTHRRLRVSGLAAIAAVVLVALFATVFFSRRGMTPPISGTPIASATPVLTDWRPSTLKTSLCGAGFFKVAPSDPRTLYVSTCSSGRQAMAVSHDGGAFWSAVGLLPGTGAGLISVDPTAAGDLLYVDSMGTDQPITLYRSTDGGTHWTQQDGIGQLPIAGLGWEGSTALLVLQQTGFSSATEIYRSFGGGPFVRIYQGADLFGFSSSDYTVLMIGGHDVTAYMTLGATNPSPASHEVILRTTDGGLHWAPVSLADSAGQPVSLQQISTDGRTLVGSVGAIGASQTYVVSTDDGASWRALPKLLRGVALSSVFLAPDGTLIAPLSTATGSPDVYELLPNAHAWRLLTFAPIAYFLLRTVQWDLVQWDAAGHPIALWSPSMVPNPQAGGQLITLYMLPL
jgi:hypothetical protein